MFCVACCLLLASCLPLVAIIRYLPVGRYSKKCIIFRNFGNYKKKFESTFKLLVACVVSNFFIHMTLRAARPEASRMFNIMPYLTL